MPLWLPVEAVAGLGHRAPDSIAVLLEAGTAIEATAKKLPYVAGY